MSENEPQLQMLWPLGELKNPPAVTVQPGYTMRTYQPSDKPAVFNLMAQVGWHGWDNARLQPWLWRVVPDGWFLIFDDASNELVASAMAIHDDTWVVPSCGEIGWVCASPQHAGVGLGKAVSAAVVARLIAGGYQHIHLYTEHFRLAALKIYLDMGFRPIPMPETDQLWKTVCEQLNWPHRPDEWQLHIDVLLSTPDKK